MEISTYAEKQFSFSTYSDIRGYKVENSIQMLPISNIPYNATQITDIQVFLKIHSNYLQVIFTLKFSFIFS